MQRKVKSQLVATAAPHCPPLALGIVVVVRSWALTHCTPLHFVLLLFAAHAVRLKDSLTNHCRSNDLLFSDSAGHWLLGFAEVHFGSLHDGRSGSKDTHAREIGSDKIQIPASRASLPAPCRHASLQTWRHALQSCLPLLKTLCSMPRRLGRATARF